jgi:hypothetical protein
MCPKRHYDFLINPDNIPKFTDCTTVNTTLNFCALTFYSSDNGNTSYLSASLSAGIEHANTSYILTGFDVPNSFDSTMAFGISYQCMTDTCNNPQNILKRILEASTIEPYRPPQLEFIIDQSTSTGTLLCSTFSNFTSIDDCRPPFDVDVSSHSNDTCSTYCVTSISIDLVDLKTERMCSYCEQEPKERFAYIDERIHLLDKRISYLQQLEYLCNSSNYCNSWENIKKYTTKIQNTF